ncbi:hypothetical protein EVAR_101339_1 [Eumeta japonica]|uniref:Uncharacterized protein n=1 Tax=Eumeta variegata TaxID=151549 RepID=A0A4C1SV31_EUMVA|nr:hypothetical protein EVAR_101339_1 [Eumeta japonica]
MEIIPILSLLRCRPPTRADVLSAAEAFISCIFEFRIHRVCCVVKGLTPPKVVLSYFFLRSLNGLAPPVGVVEQDNARPESCAVIGGIGLSRFSLPQGHQCVGSPGCLVGRNRRFSRRGSRCAPSGITILEDLPTGSATDNAAKAGEENLAAKPRLETESDSDPVAHRYGEKEELMRRVHESVKAISALVAGPGSKLNKADISNVAAHGHEILAVVTALNQRLAGGAPGCAGEAGGGEGKPSDTGAAIRKPESGPVLAIYPVAEQLENIKTAEDTKQLLKSAIDPASIQAQVTKMRKVGRAGVVVQTTSAESADKIRKTKGGPAHATSDGTAQ